MNEQVLAGCKIVIKGCLGFIGGVVTGGNPFGVAAGVTLGEMYVDWCKDSLDLESEEALAKYLTTFGFSIITGGLGAASANVLYDGAAKFGGETVAPLLNGKVPFSDGEALAQLCKDASVTTCQTGSAIAFDKAKEVMKLDEYVKDSYAVLFEPLFVPDERLRRRRLNW